MSQTPISGQRSARKGSEDGALRCELVVLKSTNEMSERAEAWDGLACAAAEPNVFYESWMARAAMDLLDESADVEILLLRQIEPELRLLGVFPIEIGRRFRGLRVRTARMWRHRHCYLTTPLLAPAALGICWGLLLDYLRRRGIALLEFERIAADGPVFASLTEYLRGSRQPYHLCELYSRALLQASGDAVRYMQQHISAGRRQTIERKSRRLADQGRLEICVLAPEEPVASAMDEFIALEAAGWKGTAGTAIVCNETDIRFFQAIAVEAHQRNKLHMIMLRLDGRMIAGMFNLMAGEGAFQIKTTYDETLGQFSPGILAYVETLRALNQQKRCRWIDSCVAPDNSAARQIWRETRLIAHIALPLTTSAGLAMASIPLMRYVKTLMRRRSAHPVTDGETE